MHIFIIFTLIIAYITGGVLSVRYDLLGRTLEFFDKRPRLEEPMSNGWAILLVGFWFPGFLFFIVVGIIEWLSPFVWGCTSAVIAWVGRMIIGTRKGSSVQTTYQYRCVMEHASNHPGTCKQCGLTLHAVVGQDARV